MEYNKIYILIQAKVVADSLSPQGNRITTMQVTFPRFILAELNTHRLFSRNSASSRAIPFAKMVKSVEENPFIPIAWQKDHKGMQGTEYFTDKLNIEAKESEWLIARNHAVNQAQQLNSMGVTKQICNRLLEPFMWHTVLITATEFSNFFNLRCPQYQTPVTKLIEPAKSKKECIRNHGNPENIEKLERFTDLDWLQINKGQSEIHMMALAEAMYDAMNESTPKQLQAGDWHIPFGEKLEEKILVNLKDKNGNDLISDATYNLRKSNNTYYKELELLKIKIATARCARVSYTVVGEEGKEPNFEKDIELHDTLATSGHWSPFEHCARAMSDEEYNSFIKGDTNNDGVDFKTTLGWCNNFRGFIQYRYLIENQ